MKKRFLSMLLAVLMVVGMLPTVALAEDGTTWDGTTVATAYAGGTGAEDAPYIIATAGQLIYLRNKVNGGTSYDGKYFRLDADLDMNSKTFGAAIGTNVNYSTSRYFNGHFDGNGHKISNLTIGNSSNGYSALFGNVGFNGQEIVIKNLTLVNVNVNRTATNYGAAALVGQPRYAKIENCTVESGTVTSAAYYAGGLVASSNTSGTYGLTIINCVNKANVTNNSTSSSPYTGGIVGEGQRAKITGCTNYGTITTNKYYAGGIAGRSHTATIEKCANYGAVSSTQGSAAGILADGSNEVVKNCYNQGNITAGKYATGITGLFGSTSGHTDTDTIENCYSVGTLIGSSKTHAISIKGSYPNNCTLKNNYSLTAGDAYVTQKTAEEFADGTVAKLLQEPNEELVWGQTIGTDAYPVFYNGNNSVMPKTYTVTWLVDGVEYAKTENLEAGAAITAPENPTKAAVGCTTYTFDKWDAEIPATMPAENLTFNAVFTEETKHELVYTDHKDGTHSASCACGQETVEKTEHTFDPIYCVCGAEKPIYVAFYSLSLKGNIGVNYYMHIDESIVTADPNGYMEFTTPRGGTVQIPIGEARVETEDSKTYYVFTATVAAKEMMDTIQGQYFYGENSSEVYEYTVKKYADIIIANAASNAAYAKMEPLAKAMLVYGAWAQKNFSYNTENLPVEVSDITEVTATDLSAFARTDKQGTALAPLDSVSLVLKTETSMRLYFNTSATLTATMNGVSLNVVKKGDNQCYVEIPNISAKNLDDTFTITINDGTEEATVSYSPMTFCYNVLNAAEGTFTNELVNTAKALYLYNQAANVYFAEN